jgi:hypothetical protein
MYGMLAMDVLRCRMCLQVSTRPLRHYSEARHFRGPPMDTPALQLPLNGYVRPAQAAPEQAAGADARRGQQ